MIGDNIRHYRKKYNMSQDELAEQLNVTRQSISLWETGQTQPTIDNIIAIAKLFQISTDELLMNTPNTKESSPARQNDSPKKSKKTLLSVLSLVLVVILVFFVVTVVKGMKSKSDNEEFIQNTDSLDEIKETPDLDKLYDYLKEYAIENGIINGDYCYYSDDATRYGGAEGERFALYYWGDTDTVEFSLHSVIDDTFSVCFYLRVPQTYTGQYEYISSYYYRDNGEPLYEAKGMIDAPTFTKNYPLNCTKYIGTTEKQNDFMEFSRMGICELLNCLEQFTTVEKLDYSFTDLGFTQFE